MESFATILNRFLRAPSTTASKAKPSTSFEDAVNAFEAHVAKSLEGAGAIDAALAADVAAWAIELGVAAPCSVADLKRAYRRRVFETHPDRVGGSHAAFLRVQAAFEEANAALKSVSVAAPLRSAPSRYAQAIPAAAPMRVRTA